MNKLIILEGLIKIYKISNPNGLNYNGNYNVNSDISINE